MADTEDKERAEKLAAARKKAQQALKKKKAGQKTAKAKEDKAEAEAEAEPSVDGAEKDGSKETPTVEEDAAEEAGEAVIATTTEETEAKVGKKATQHGRQMSVSAQSKLRSESFRNNPGPLSPTILSPTGNRSEDLEMENKRLQIEGEEARSRLERLEEELEELRGERSNHVQKLQQAEDAGKEAEKLKAEVATLQRQNAQLQSAASKRKSSISNVPGESNADLVAQISSKSSTIESLEIELSKLNTQVATLQSSTTTQADRISELESQLEKASQSASSTAQELSDLKANLEKASKEEGSSKDSAETRLAQLSAELGTAQRSAADATARSGTLEKKIEALTGLHKEADARSQTKITELQKHEREAKELRSRVGALSDQVSRLTDEAIRKRKADAGGADTGLDELEDEERTRLQSRVRDLEEEVYDLRRGVWRDKRRAMQPGMEEHNGFDEVELSPSAPQGGWSGSAAQRPQGQQHSSFTDVLNSGIAAFTGGDNRRRRSSLKNTPRKQSVGMMSEDDFEFDENAFRMAQEEEAKNRLERIRDIKRGMHQWKTFKVDLVEVRSAMGGVFDV